MSLTAAVPRAHDDHLPTRFGTPLATASDWRTNVN
jgi:hypothetical protein